MRCRITAYHLFVFVVVSFMSVSQTDGYLYIERDLCASVCRLTLQNRGRGDILSDCCGYYDEVICLR